MNLLQTSIEEAHSNLGNKKTRKWKLVAKTGDHTQITGITTNLSKGMITAGQLANENSKQNYPSLIQRLPKNGGVLTKKWTRGEGFFTRVPVTMEDKACKRKAIMFTFVETKEAKKIQFGRYDSSNSGS